VTTEDDAMIGSAGVRQICLPDSDGQPMADNTLQFDWITTLKWGCDLLFADRPDVFVAGDHLIYPVMPTEEDQEEGREPIRIAPDVYVAFGRPKGHRGSYKVWEEGGIFPQVVFEVWSPGNRVQQMNEKRRTYERFGAEEYYVIYPELPAFVEAWIRKGDKLVVVDDVKTWVSPRLEIRFAIQKGVLEVLRRDGTPFLTYLELGQKLTDVTNRAEQEAKRAEQEAKRAEQEAKRAEQEAKRAEQEAKRANELSAERDTERERAERLAAKLRALGLDPDAS